MPSLRRRDLFLRQGLLLQLQVPTDGPEHPSRCFFAQCGGTAQPELLFDVHLVCFDRLHAQVQFVRQAHCAEAATDQRENLQLTITQDFKLGWTLLDRTDSEALQKSSCHVWARVKAASGDLNERHQNLRNLISVEQISARPRPKGALHRQCVFPSREHNCATGWVQFAEILNQFNAVSTTKGEPEQNDLWLILHEQLPRRWYCVSFGADFESAVLSDDLNQREPHQRTIVNDEYFRFCQGLHRGFDREDRGVPAVFFDRGGLIARPAVPRRCSKSRS